MLYWKPRIRLPSRGELPQAGRHLMKTIDPGEHAGFARRSLPRLRAMAAVTNLLAWLLFVVLAWVPSVVRGVGAARSGPLPPNVIFIVADDLGYGDLSCYGNPDVETPVLDRLAAAGVRFTDYYAASPLCAPSRAAMLTGRFNHRTGAVDVSSNQGIDRIALSEKTFGDYFRHAGYATALIGKWHNGLYNQAYLPHRRGFDLFYGFPNGGHDYWKWHLQRNDAQEAADGRYLTDALNDEAMAFVERNRARPFALFLAHHAPHVPLQAPDALVAKYLERGRGRYGRAVATIYAMIEVMDTGIGRLLAKVEACGLRERTIVVFTSDNGAVLGPSSEMPGDNTHRYHGPYRGNKDNVLEQGIRVPAMVAWPGTVPAGRVSDVPVHGCDWLPTLFALTGADAPAGAKPFDGVDVFALWGGDRPQALLERTLPFQKNRYTPVAHSNAAIRQGPWKLLWPIVSETTKKDNFRDAPSYQRGVVNPHWEMPLDPDVPTYTRVRKVQPQLFNLAADPGETRDVAADHPALAAELTRRYDAWFNEVFAEWQQANREIREQDRLYWSTRKAPDPRALFRDFWRWKGSGADPANDDPLKVFRGFWSYPEWR